MRIHDSILCTVVFILLFFAKSTFSKSPHIIFMLIDDLGWNDVSFHGSLQIPTPNIDTLAFTGTVLNNYYVQPICTPSRGSLMTGKYPIRLGLQHFVICPGEPWGLSPKETILPQYLKRLGYETHAIGKWHLGYFKKEYLPTNRGFDSFFGFYEGKGDYFTHFDIKDGKSGFDFQDNGKLAWNYIGYYSTEAFTDRAKRVISNHNSSKPLFLYLSHQAPHAGNKLAPLQAPKEYVERFSHIKDEKRRTFAAMMSVLDWSVGEIFTALHEKDMLENSIIIFSTDNGGAVEGMEGTSGSNWPLRGSKINMWEGGVRGTAFIWSALFLSSRQPISKNLMHISDWLPTLYAAAGGNVEDLGQIDGYNFWPSFDGNSSAPRDRILHNIDPVLEVEGIRKNQYKLLKGSVFRGAFDGWYDKEGKNKERAPFDDEELDTFHKVFINQLHQSEVYKILVNNCENDLDFQTSSIIKHREYCSSASNQHQSHFIIENNQKTHYMHYSSLPVEVHCGTKPDNAAQNCLPMEDYCLFDVEKDPCEYINLAKALPSVTEELKGLLNEYRKQAVPIRNKPVDPYANPKYHGYAWVPWKEESHTIL